MVIEVREFFLIIPSTYNCAFGFSNWEQIHRVLQHTKPFNKEILELKKYNGTYKHPFGFRWHGTALWSLWFRRHFIPSSLVFWNVPAPIFFGFLSWEEKQ